jgi:hypothetical protein
MTGKSGTLATGRLDFGDLPLETTTGRGFRNGLRLAVPAGRVHGPDKYKDLDLKRRRAQIRARRALGVV